MAQCPHQPSCCSRSKTHPASEGRTVQGRPASQCRARTSLGPWRQRSRPPSSLPKAARKSSKARRL
eukprot:8463242-Alexandrium_andersonii.AAC.1